ncbi:MAG: ABC transporter permease [Chloroflexi bacterium]|nr:ABC transporter permease [Chloroflexota bacterium]
MSAIAQNDASPSAVDRGRQVVNSFLRVLKYSLMRLASLLFSVVVAIFLTILIANMGGRVDEMRLGEIRETVVQTVRGNQANRNLPPDQFQKLVDDLVFQEAHAQGLDQPLMLRAVRFMEKALTLNLGNALRMTSDSGSKQVRIIILERLPPTLLLWGVSGLLLFFAEISVALSISRKYGTWVDKFFVAMAPLSTAPGWFFGIFLILLFASYFRVLPFGGMVDAPIPKTTLGYSLSVIKHLILPTLSLAIASFFLQVYQWRTFFLIYSSEEYVDIAKAKGLSSRTIERDYVLRPTLPNIITGFALTLIALWLGGPITETIFNWPGLGRAFYEAVQFYDTPVILGQTVIYAYMLAFTVFLLDYIYALVDPRVKVGQGGGGA